MIVEQGSPLLILLAGPTGVGKTSLSLEIADVLGAEIINADSMQIYRLMDIGTAKPTSEERAAIRHHLIDIAYPDEPFDAARYLELAGPVIDGLHEKSKTPLVVGGTGLYMKVLTKGICSGPAGDPRMREELLREEKERGLAAMHAELMRVDSVLGERIHPNDRQRILRALEVWRATGMPLSKQQEEHGFERALYRSIKIFLYREREELYERINRRVRAMMEQGFLDEVRSLIGLGYGPELKSMQSLGYRQLARHLLEACPLDEAVQEIQRETRRYAKRQATWFRGDPEFHWVAADRKDEVLRRIEQGMKSRTQSG